MKTLFNKRREEGMENVNTFVTGVYIGTFCCLPTDGF